MSGFRKVILWSLYHLTAVLGVRKYAWFVYEVLFLKNRSSKIDAFSGLIDRDALCFDVGANRGWLTDTFLALGARRIIAVEPNRECVEYLKTKYRNRPVTIIASGLGGRVGEATLYVTDETALSSFSRPFIDKTAESDVVVSGKRLSKYRWKEAYDVKITTLDLLISRYGRPEFCKIDAEGMEDEILSGLTFPINALCFEFHSRLKDKSFRCLDHLSNIGDYEYNYNLHARESEGHCGLISEKWLRLTEIQDILNGLADDEAGDIYCRLSQDR